MIKLCFVALFLTVNLWAIDCPPTQLILKDVDEYLDLVKKGYINPDEPIELFFKNDGLAKSASVSPFKFFPSALSNMDTPHNVLHNIHETQGPLARLRVPGIKRKLYFLADPEKIEEVLKDTANGTRGRFEKSELTGKPFRPLVGDDNVFTAKAAVWKRQRKDASPHFTAMTFTTPKFTEDMQSVITRTQAEWKMAIKGKASAPIDIAGSMTDLTLRGLFKVFFGHTIPLEETKEIEEAFSVVLRSLSYEAANPFNKALHELPHLHPGQKKLAQAHEKLNQYARKIINERKANPHSPGQKDLLDRLIEAKNAKGVAVSESEMANQLKTYLLAGHETTSTGLTWSYYQILKDPAVKKKLMKEIRSAFPPGHKITGKDLEKLPYLDQVWNESLRLNSPVPLIARRAETGVELASGAVKAKVNKGDDVVLSILEANRSEKTWGKEATGFAANEFHPERFSADNLKIHGMKHGDLKHLAYGSGNRVCLGQFFANAEGKMTLAQSFLDFDMDLSKTGKAIKIRSDGSYKIDGALMVDFKARP